MSNPNVVTDINELEDLFAEDFEAGSLEHEAQPFEGLATLIPNPLNGGMTHVIVQTKDGQIFYLHPVSRRTQATDLGSRAMFTNARDLAYMGETVQVRIDATGVAYWNEFGYETDANGQITAKSDEFEVGQLANWAHNTYSAARDLQVEGASFEGVTLYRKQADTARARTQPHRLSEFGEKYLQAIQRAKSNGDTKHIAALVKLAVQAFGFAGFDREQKTLIPQAGNLEQTLFSQTVSRLLNAKAAPQEQASSDEKTASEKKNETVTAGDGTPDTGF